MRGLLSIFLAHNYYSTSSPSGEDVAFKAETEVAPQQRPSAFRRRSASVVSVKQRGANA